MVSYTANLKNSIRKLEKQINGDDCISLLDSEPFDLDELEEYYNHLWKATQPNWGGHCPIGADENYC